MIFRVFQAFFVTSLPVKNIVFIDIHFAFLLTNPAASVCFMQTFFPYLFYRVLFKFIIDYYASKSSAAPVPGYKHIIYAECSHPGYMCYMPVRPIAHQSCSIKIMGERKQKKNACIK
jgi:hypothetical protein